MPFLVPRLHSAPIPGSNLGGGSDPSCVLRGGGGGSLTRVYTVIALKEQTPKRARTKAQVRNFSCYTWKSSIHCGGRPSFLFTHTNKAVSNPSNLEDHKRRVRTRNRGRWFVFTLRGKRRVWPPRIWGSTPQSEYVKASVFGTLNSAISNFQTWFLRTVMEVLKYCWMWETSNMQCN